MSKKKACKSVKSKKTKIFKRLIAAELDISINRVKIHYIQPTSIFTTITIKAIRKGNEDLIIKCNDKRIKKALKINNQDIKAFHLLDNKIYIYMNPKITINE